MRESNIDLNMSTVLVTGAAGFIGAALCKNLLEAFPGVRIVGVDNLNSYYDVKLKQERLRLLLREERFTFDEGTRIDIADRASTEAVMNRFMPDVVVHLAAQAGVRYSIDHPDTYIRSNILGFFHVLEACRALQTQVKHLVYASSSSVYGNQEKVPYSTSDMTDAPVSLYAATKKADELMAYAYSTLYGIPMTGLRFFTVYGPFGRPDMAYYSFTEKLRAGETIRLFNYGDCKRDFTYIDDIVDGVTRVMQSAPERQPAAAGSAPAGNAAGQTPHRLYNIGNHHPENLTDFVQTLCEELIRAGVLPVDFDLSAHEELTAMQPGDVETTCADVEDLIRDFGFAPDTPLREGLQKFAAWYHDFMH